MGDQARRKRTVVNCNNRDRIVFDTLRKRVSGRKPIRDARNRCTTIDKSISRNGFLVWKRKSDRNKKMVWVIKRRRGCRKNITRCGLGKRRVRPVRITYKLGLRR